MTELFAPLSEVIHARKSVRKFDSEYQIAPEVIEDMLQEATLAPSSSNLQPWRFIVIQDEEAKKKIKEFSFNQEQMETSSAIIAVIGDTEMYHNIDEIYLSNLKAGNIDEVNVQRQIDNAKALYPNAPTDARLTIAAFDAGLVSMQLMLIAKAKGYDTVPMGGFDKAQFAKEFNLEERYVPLVLIALGKAAAPAYGSTRLPLEKITTFV
ncbi:nitroreductase family protein [Sporosarcina sp. BI001-red]|uniref:nitroreductase family protein n=1 Tax=Sporosarcina sp. BI001-red TaxID=2282866 RepID=UPI000E234CC3|nr:nitroreductase family protein [Sporosarcina sp. BI001-red]REB08095.1 nitroreductase family protein [Sporosarcina sp. BI001-red]